MASNYLSPLNTKLDASQVIRRAYDEPNNRLRVDAQVSATIGTVDVVIDAASGDNIKISDGVNTLIVNPDGSINVMTELSHINDSVSIGDGINLAKMIPSNDLSKVGVSTVQINTIFSKPYDRLRVTSKNDDGDPLVIESMFSGSVVQTATLIYDVDGDFQDISVVG
jgi:hypothetical protein